MRRSLVLALASLMATCSAVAAHEASNAGITVAHPWVRANPGGTTLTSGYLEIKADKGVIDRLIGAASPAAGRVEIHTHEMDGDIMRMRKVEGLDIKPESAKVLRPSGDHLMLFDLKKPLADGDLVKLDLTFEKAGTISIEATVEPVGAMGPHGMSHQPGHGDDAQEDHSGHGDHGAKTPAKMDMHKGH